MTRLTRWLPLLLALVAALGLWAWWHQRDARLRAEGALASETRQHQQALDSASRVAARADTVVRLAVDTLRVRTTRYQQLRVLVPTFDTTRFVTVDTQYVVTADSVVKACGLVEQTCESRHRADSVRYAALARLTADYKAAAGLQRARRFRLAPAIFAGLGVDGHAAAGVGLALTWGR